MTLKEHIEDIHEGLKTNRYPDEAAVSQGIVLRLLGTLGWSTYDTQVVFPQYGIEGRKVDFALCYPASKPIVFIEVKRVGNIEGAERQLFEYAFHKGIPIAILTDGQTWRFFYPIGEGNYRERKVHEMDLTKGDSEEHAKWLNRYLNYESIRTGAAVEAIKEDYEKVVQQRQVATRLPEAWSKLVAKADDFLIDIVAEKVESLCGHRPTDEQILDFLKNLERIQLGETFPSPTPQSFSTFANQRSIGSKAPPKRLVVTMPNGEVIQHHNAMATFREVIFKLGPENVLQVDREGKLISTEPISQRRTTPYRGYHVTGNHGTPVKRNLLEKIAERLRVPLKVEIVD